MSICMHTSLALPYTAQVTQIHPQFAAYHVLEVAIYLVGTLQTMDYNLTTRFQKNNGQRGPVIEAVKLGIGLLSIGWAG